ncbi:hypothetical protein P153DRAFT_153813 [Dothidotthia symphoricarpi CBS 119687]|uniref:Uncharacterized protein n=1 Tax=Dothidotthia symphoricarpi CBS 119687 TaxID=1392245 RepID=A0A6A6AQP4_9PLEO|nr:uncharacterized protein P153DRAFT_153813 [Dothidotthia symphoricarpi CBS 119687]KAF2133284.1 hypothetical protein P153DRAFT_153813 [Dothidotthia symphoricarpi CBS 119687]
MSQLAGLYGPNNPPPPLPGAPSQGDCGPYGIPLAARSTPHLAPPTFDRTCQRQLSSVQVQTPLQHNSPPVVEDYRYFRPPLKSNERTRQDHRQGRASVQSRVQKYTDDIYDRGRSRSRSPTRTDDRGNEQWRERSLARKSKVQNQEGLHHQVQNTQPVRHTAVRTSDNAYDRSQGSWPRQQSVKGDTEHDKHATKTQHIRSNTALEDLPHLPKSAPGTGKRNRSYNARAKRRALKQQAALGDTQRQWSPVRDGASPKTFADSHHRKASGQRQSQMDGRESMHHDGQPGWDRFVRPEFHEYAGAAVASEPSYVDVEDEIDWDDEDLYIEPPARDSTSSHQYAKMAEHVVSRQQKFSLDHTRGVSAKQRTSPVPSSGSFAAWRKERGGTHDSTMPQGVPQFEQRASAAKLRQDYKRGQDQRFDDPNFIRVADNARTQQRQHPVQHKARTEPQLQHAAHNPSITRKELETPAPPTAYNLRGYEALVLSRSDTQRFKHGNGKVTPRHYGSSGNRDLGLCFATFCTKFACELGVKCPWRHHPLTKAEKEWIVTIGGKREEEFLDNVDRWWALPDVPVPGACMHGKRK